MWPDETIDHRLPPDVDAYRRKDYGVKKPKWKEDSETLRREDLKRRSELEQRMRRVERARRATERSTEVRADQKAKTLVLGALNNSKYEWRTILGIAEETGLDPEIVVKALSEFKSGVVRSSRFTRDGRALYTTRSRHEEFAPFWRKVLGAIKNQID